MTTQHHASYAEVRGNALSLDAATHFWLSLMALQTQSYFSPIVKV